MACLPNYGTLGAVEMLAEFAFELSDGELIDRHFLLRSLVTVDVSRYAQLKHFFDRDEQAQSDSG